MSLKYGLLGLLTSEPLHGYEVKNRFEAMLGGTWEVNIGQVYTGQDWCAALTANGGSCANVDLTKTTVIGLDIMRQFGTLDTFKISWTAPQNDIDVWFYDDKGNVIGKSTTSLRSSRAPEKRRSLVI